MPLRVDAIGICPANLVPEPLVASGDTFERTIRGATAEATRRRVDN